LGIVPTRELHLTKAPVKKGESDRAHPSVTALAIAFLGEILDNWLGFRFARRYGGSTRSGWGALLGRAAGSAAKIALGLVLVVISVVIALS